MLPCKLVYIRDGYWFLSYIAYMHLSTRLSELRLTASNAVQFSAQLKRSGEKSWPNLCLCPGICLETHTHTHTHTHTIRMVGVRA
jgi:hypothetical protein